MDTVDFTRGRLLDVSPHQHQTPPYAPADPGLHQWQAEDPLTAPPQSLAGSETLSDLEENQTGERRGPHKKQEEVKM